MFGAAHYLAGRRGGLSSGSGARAGEGEAPNVARERRAKQRRRRRGPSETRGAAATAADELSGLAGPAGVTKPLQHWHPRRRRSPSGHLTPARVEEVAADKEAWAAGEREREQGGREGREGRGSWCCRAALGPARQYRPQPEGVAVGESPPPLPFPSSRPLGLALFIIHSRRPRTAPPPFFLSASPPPEAVARRGGGERGQRGTL